MGKKLYLECETGISGDMTVASLLDLGADLEGLKLVLDSLNVSGFSVRTSRVKKAGLDCMDFNVVLDAHHENHDHDMEYLYGHEHHHEHHHEHNHEDHEHSHSGYEHHHEHGEHIHEHNHEDHHHEHGHEGHEHHHHHEHRGFNEIKQIIENSALTDRAKQIAIKIFEVIANAEAKAHGESFDKVHFHEVGAVDSIVDVLAIAYCIDNLDITDVIVPYLCEGKGSVRCAHGILPVPVPAVANIVAEHNVTLKISEARGELVTPTGAAVVGALRTSDKLPESFRVKKIGLGAGKRNYERPSIVRAMIIEDDASKSDIIYKLETDIDDCSGEQLGFTMEKLYEAGAKEVHYMPIFMKKNRPAYELVCICDKNDVSTMENIIFKHTTTIGIRKCEMERTVLSRSFEKIDTKYGEVTVKKCILPDSTVRAYPEYESIKDIADKTGVAFGEIINEVKKSL